MQLALSPLLRYADFQGRSRRLEFWLFLAMNAAALFLFAFLAGAANQASFNQASSMGGTIMSVVIILLWLAVLIPMLAVMVRRFHDQDRSGWFVLMNFIPGVGGLLVLIFMCLPGTIGDNQYGTDPKMNELNQ